MVEIVLDKEIGQLVPVLLDARGRTIDGSHRKQRDKGWRTERLKHIDTEEKFLRARLLANDNRRVMEAEEIGEILNGLAEIYRKQGGKPGEIAQLVADKTGYDRSTVDGYLRVEFKDKSHRESTLLGLERTAPTRKLVAAARQAQDEVNKALSRALKDPALDEDNKKMIAREVKSRLSFAKAIDTHVDIVKKANAAGEAPPEKTVVSVQGDWLVKSLESAAEAFSGCSWKAAKELSAPQIRQCRSLVVRVKDHADAWLRQLERLQEGGD
ncbi:MAG: hypothetical protein DME69_14685 [Verrucomicrobia bacterium]|nr:MAG: hypothetical protein DME69_14685 [Verrucomicrobiota bacterium]